MSNTKAPNSDMEKTRKRVIGDYKKGAKPKELSEKYGVSINTVKSWISRSKSKNAPVEPGASSAPAPRKPGAPLGNTNAVGNCGGAPVGNTNALKHGGYSRIFWDTLDEEEKQMLEDGTYRGAVASISSGKESISYTAVGTTASVYSSAAANATEQARLVGSIACKYLANIPDATGVNLLYAGG